MFAQKNHNFWFWWLVVFVLAVFFTLTGETVFHSSILAGGAALVMVIQIGWGLFLIKYYAFKRRH